MSKANESRSPSDGFEGAISGLSLSDVIQLNVQNRFSGCIDVAYDERRGLIFFRDGEIIHAEQDGIVGEDAFCAVVTWPGGHFTVQPNVTTTQSTIRKTCQHLLLEAHRLMDERQARRSGPPSRAPPAAAPKTVSASGLVERLREVPGVAYAVVQQRDGAIVEDDSYDAEVLGGQAIYLAMIGNRLGESLRLGDVHSAAVQGTTRNLLFFAMRNHYLCVLVDHEAQVGLIEAAVRKILTSSR